MYINLYHIYFRNIKNYYFFNNSTICLTVAPHAEGPWGQAAGRRAEGPREAVGKDYRGEEGPRGRGEADTGGRYGGRGADIPQFFTQLCSTLNHFT